MRCIVPSGTIHVCVVVRGVTHQIQVRMCVNDRGCDHNIKLLALISKNANTNCGERKHFIALSKDGMPVDNNMGMNHVLRTECDVLPDHTERTNLTAGINLCARVDDGGWVNHSIIRERHKN